MRHIYEEHKYQLAVTYREAKSSGNFKKIWSAYKKSTDLEPATYLHVYRAWINNSLLLLIDRDIVEKLLYNQ